MIGGLSSNKPAPKGSGGDDIGAGSIKMEVTAPISIVSVSNKYGNPFLCLRKQ